MRRLFPAFRTLPSSTYCTPRSCPIVRKSLVVPFNCIDDVRDVTWSALTFARSEINSSVRPSLK